MRRSTLAFALLLAALTAVVSGCRESQQAATSNDDVNFALEITPEPPTVGEATLLVTLTDNEGNPITDATVAVNGDMNHAGMVPVEREVSENTDGVYEVPFEWTMGGDWILTVTAMLADDTTARQTFDVTGVSSDGSGMDMTDEATPEATPETTPETTPESAASSASVAIGNCATPETDATDDGTCGVAVPPESSFGISGGNE